MASWTYFFSEELIDFFKNSIHLAWELIRRYLSMRDAGLPWIEVTALRRSSNGWSSSAVRLSFVDSNQGDLTFIRSLFIGGCGTFE